MMEIFSDEVSSITEVFICLHEKYDALQISYAQVLADTTLSIEDAVRQKVLFDGELAALIEDADAQIVVLEGERDLLVIDRDTLVTAYNALVAGSEEAAAGVVINIQLLTKAYDDMVLAKAGMISKLDEFRSQIGTMFTVLDSKATTATNEICS